MYMGWSLLRSMLWSSVSKAAERCKGVGRTTLPESSERRMSFVILRNWLFQCDGEGSKQVEKDR